MFIIYFVFANNISKICIMRLITIIHHKGLDVEIRAAFKYFQDANIYIKDVFLGKYIRQQLYPEGILDESFEALIKAQLEKWDRESPLK